MRLSLPIRKKAEVPPDTGASGLFIDPSQTQPARGPVVDVSAQEVFDDRPLFLDVLEPAPESPEGVAAPVQAATSVKRKFKLGFGRKKAAKAVPSPDATPSKAPAAVVKRGLFGRRVTAPTFQTLPVRVILGYLPEVTERDAREYAQGLAEKHFDQRGLSFFGAFKYENGYTFEAHEGGDGKAYLPPIQQYFKSLGPFQSGEPAAVVIRTATRKVEVQRLREGLTAIFLPEESAKPVTDWLVGTKPLTPLVNRQKGFLVGGFLVFATGVAGMLLTAVFFRLQGYSPAPPQAVDVISLTPLPRTQWFVLEKLPAGSHVVALRFKDGEWQAPELDTDDSTSDGSPEPADAASSGAEKASSGTAHDDVTTKSPNAEKSQ